MAKPRGSGHSDGDAAPAGRSRAAGGRGPENVAEAQEITAQAANAGRPGGSGRRSDNLVTSPTGQPGSAPDGHPTRIGPREDDDVRRSLEWENSGAAILADRGHHVQQNPSAAEIVRAREATGDTGAANSNPDYLVDGRVFDCYSPKPTKGVRGIWSEVEGKIVDGQTQRVVINLQGWQGATSDLRRQFSDWPIDRLKEVKAITPDGDIVQIVPDPESD